MEITSCVYILQSEKSGKFYIGSAIDPIIRLTEHNNGFVKSTRNKGPWIIKMTQKYQNQTIAKKIEYKLKKLRRKDYIEKIVEGGCIKITVD